MTDDAEHPDLEPSQTEQLKDLIRKNIVPALRTLAKPALNDRQEEGDGDSAITKTDPSEFSGLGESAAYYCPTCGEAVDFVDTFCRHCGEDLCKTTNGK